MAAFSHTNQLMSPTDFFHRSSFWKIPAFVAGLLLLELNCVIAADAAEVEPAPNPHGDPAQCSRCHTSTVEGRAALRFAGDTSSLCRSCHDGRLAAGEAHPVAMAPSAIVAGRIGTQFPLENGTLSCLSCHDVTWHCKSGRPSVLPNRSFLRGSTVSHPMEFCFQCHERENYRPFNAHDQLEAGVAKAETCAWCHVRVPDVSSRLKEGASYALRSESFGVCNNCHLVNKNHPTEAPHMHAVPSPEMMWHMSAYELQARMNLEYKQLLEYVRASKRAPRLIPLDENGRITCYSCHNPHEKGLLPDWNPRSVGAEPKHAANHRLRTHGGIACRACHEK